ncbi:MAG: CHASE domain-containing protein [Phycisphaeraceae bacterium]
MSARLFRRSWLVPLRRQRRRLAVLAVLLAGLAMTATMYVALSQREARLAQMRFESLAEDRIRVLERRIEDVFETVHLMAGFYQGAGNVSWRQFQRYADSLIERHEGLRLLLWAPRVSAAQRPALEIAGPMLFDQRFRITEQREPGELVPADERAVYFPIYYLVPAEVHAPMWGLDLAAHPPAGEAIARARETGMLTATAPIVLVSDLGTIRSIWVFQVVHENHELAGDVQDRPTRGVVAGVIEPAPMLEAIRSLTSQRDMALEIHDGQAPRAYRLVYRSPQEAADDEDDEAAADEQAELAQASWRLATVGELRKTARSTTQGLHTSASADDVPRPYSAEMTIADRTWQVTATPTDAFFQARRSWAPSIVLVGGLLITALAALFLNRMMAHTQQVEATVARRTAELRETNAALHRSNTALQEFAYIASHDLQEPLRKVRGFGDLLAGEAGERLDDQQREYLQRMQNAATRMQGLIQGLLNYSRVTTRSQPFEPVNLEEIARQVVGDLEMRLQDTGGEVAIGDLPTVDADPLQMRQLFQNLIGNGLKFHRPDVPPRVQVRAADVDTDTVRLEIEDNGVGFEPEDAERLFKPFERMHDRAAYEGSGMGLAVCKRIVERHGGTITAYGRPNAGATFVVTLPHHHQRGETADVSEDGSTSDHSDGG